MAILFRIPLLALSAAFLLIACQAEEAAEETFSVQLQCQTITSEESSAKSAVYAIVNQNKVKLATISSCDSIPPASYEDYDIPAGALVAAGGWWAGSGDYIYAIREDSVVAFYQGWMEEGQEDATFHYTRIGEFLQGRFNLQIPVRKEELVGTYALSREAGSHILFVGMKGDSLVAEYFQMDGILPPVNQLNILMSSLEREEASYLAINPSTLQFTSGLGKGQFLHLEGASAVLLADQEVDGQPLRMEKILSEDYSIPVQ